MGEKQMNKTNNNDAKDNLINEVKDAPQNPTEDEILISRTFTKPKPEVLIVGGDHIPASLKALIERY